MIKGFIHFFVKAIMRFILHLFHIFPVKENRIVLLNELSFSYGDNMKYINEYLRKEKPDSFEIIFPIKKANGAEADNIVMVKPMSIKYFYYLLTGRVIITNSGGISYLPIRKDKQIVINTWHGGGPYKKTGTDVNKSLFFKWETQMNAGNITYMLEACKYSRVEYRSLLISGKKCVKSGMPRNDLFFRKDDQIKDKVRKTYGLQKETKVILYAPTFRGDAGNAIANADVFQMKEYTLDHKRVIDACEKRFKGDWRLAVRLHPKLKNVEFGDNTIMNMTTYPDMQELLYTVDAVITDYSSLMWDFSLTGRPIFLYADDIEDYDRRRGFYMPASKWPYPIAHNNDEMEWNILNFREETYQAAVRQHHKDSGSYETGHACEAVARLIERGRNSKNG